MFCLRLVAVIFSEINGITEVTTPSLEHPTASLSARYTLFSEADAYLAAISRNVRRKQSTAAQTKAS